MCCHLKRIKCRKHKKGKNKIQNKRQLLWAVKNNKEQLIYIC